MGDDLAFTAMSDYERRRWAELNEYWQKPPRTVLPARTREALAAAGEKGQDLAISAGRRLSDATPEKVKNVGVGAADATLASTVKAVTKLLEFTEEVAAELTDPGKVIAHHKAKGHNVETIEDLQRLDLKHLDAYTRRMGLKWRAGGALQGGALGALAFVPGPGTFASITLDVVASHVLTTAIATRVAYAYGFDAMDPDQQLLVQRMVRRSYKEMGSKAESVRRSAKAFEAGRGRRNWSNKLRQDEKLLAAVEALMARFTGGHVPVEKVVSKLPTIAIVTTAGLNQHMLGDTAKQARLYAATVLLSQKYELPLPTRLAESIDEPLLDLGAGTTDQDETR